MERPPSVALSPKSIDRRLNDDNINIFMTREELGAHINEMNIKYPKKT